ncbi:hypothetical protein [Chitinimonas sp.]|uniref:hypothetical protein n=1 Tax=Chitinimonas sp. TaxID=1934313 RepID=UPI0035B47C7E
MRLFSSLLAAVFSLAIAIVTHAASASRVEFDFRNAFLPNLHHFLLDTALSKGGLEAVVWASPPEAQELQQLRQALGYYRSYFAKRDLLFDHEAHAIELTLASNDTERDPGKLALPAEQVKAMQLAAPVYTRCLWAEHQRQNQAWIANARELDQRYGAAVQQEVERILAHDFHRGRYLVEVVARSGHWAGAYTFDDPLTIMPSATPGYQGLAALEMIYHETSHVGVTDTVSDAIDRLQKASHRKAAMLWHAVQFYSVGEATKQALQRGGQQYQPYADANHVYERAWPQAIGLIRQHWGAYMRGERTMEAALQAIIEGNSPAN